MTKILVIEDELSVRENLLELLEAENYETIEAANGEIGIQKAISESPDLILCDLMMPEVDGYGVLTALREEPITAIIPFIFLTAKSAKSDLRQGMDLGADDYITKPFTRTELLSAIISRLSKQVLLQKYTIKNNIRISASEVKTIEASLRRAIESKDCCELEIYYKPIINIVSRKIVAAESFVTWNSPELGTIYPLELIPLAVSTGLIIELGDWLLQSICIQNKIWSDSGLLRLPISINLSTSQFQHSDLVLKISKALAENYLEPNQIQVEINETTIAENINSAIAIINNLKSVGVRIAIDDFGTGNSSLIYLKKLPVHTLKIDSYFIHNLTNDKQKSAITNALIQMAHNLDIEVIAQGVESEAELIFLKNQNCNLMQGSLFGSLLSTADLERAILVPDC